MRSAVTFGTEELILIETFEPSAIDGKNSNIQLTRTDALQYVRILAPIWHLTSETWTHGIQMNASYTPNWNSNGAISVVSLSSETIDMHHLHKYIAQIIYFSRNTIHVCSSWSGARWTNVIIESNFSLHANHTHIRSPKLIARMSSSPPP